MVINFGLWELFAIPYVIWVAMSEWIYDSIVIVNSCVKWVNIVYTVLWDTGNKLSWFGNVWFM